ncbi:PqqD family protein [Prosthecomicrobium pneumaticum]|uniref:PqqD family protein n=1 Tax=Prosthecomicrobium pneumaticum TaxID=81895 RepID=A0A7W9L426_9HYPH|nr:PqqD family protein [Prosthecomicrobium pneumaticum]MBB5755151.1 hypothetical protein [Prosthecomicrobium pneumaticum]
MTGTYRKRGNASLLAVGSETVLLRTDAASSFALNESGLVLWDALDHFETAEDLAILMCEARRGMAAEAAEAEVRAFLRVLVDQGLLSHALPANARRFRKVDDVFVEPVGGEVMVVSRGSRKAHLLNEAGAILWDALDLFDTTADLEALLCEAWPDATPEHVAATVESFLARLLELGLIHGDA